MSLLSGRRVFPKAGGHGVGSKKTLPSTVHDSAGQYVSSLFDLAHNNSARTMFASSRQETQLVLRSWNRKSGGKDPYGVDDGTAKIDRFKIMRDDSKSVGWWRDTIERKPAELSVIELSGVLKAGQDGGFKGQAYQKAVRKAFQKVAGIRRSIAKSPEMNGTTLLIVTGTGGAQKSRGLVAHLGEELQGADVGDRSRRPGRQRPLRRSTRPSPRPAGSSRATPAPSPSGSAT